MFFMIQIERTSETPIHVQLVSRIRFLIANGQFDRGENLPSTRKLGDQLGISFHTVRKAYAALEMEGLVESRHGSGFRVLDFEPPSKTERMEQGAAIIQDALERLIGLGVNDEELEYLIEEQMSLLETEEYQYKIVVAGPFREWGQKCAEQLFIEFQKEIIPTHLEDLERHADADYVLVPFSELRSTLSNTPNADVIGIQTQYDAEALGMAARLLDRETLGLVSRYSDAIGPLTSELRSLTRFSGQILAVSVQDGDSHLAPLLKQCDLVLYTPEAGRRIQPFLTKIRKHAQLTITVSESSIERLRKLIPT